MNLRYFDPWGGASRLVIVVVWFRMKTLIVLVLLMDKILHDPKDPKLWELWYIPYNGN